VSEQSTGSGTLTPASSSPAIVRVWDLPLRLCHWLLAAAVLTAWFSANVYDSVHEIAGYSALGLLAFRLLWGFVGPPNARLRNLAYSPRAVLHHLGQLARGRSRRHLGHNPAGAAMTIALLALIAISAASGWMQLTQQFFGVTWVEEVHSYSSNLVLILVVIHVLGVILMCVQHRENLVRAMITGKKELRGDEATPISS
jgi:cytochrome b